MKTFKEQYTSLPGGSKPLFAQARQQLFLADDHILVVNPGAYSEESYRIALGDIQALTVSKTIEWIIWLIAIGCAMFGVILIMGSFDLVSNLFQEDAIPYYVIGSILLFLFLVLLIPFLIIAIKGPTCKCVLRTAVKQHHLSSLGRVRTAKKAIAMIAQAAYAQQGNFAVVEEEVDSVDAVDKVESEDKMEVGLGVNESGVDG